MPAAVRSVSLWICRNCECLQSALCAAPHTIMNAAAAEWMASEWNAIRFVLWVELHRSIDTHFSTFLVVYFRFDSAVILFLWFLVAASPQLHVVFDWKKTERGRKKAWNSWTIVSSSCSYFEFLNVIGITAIHLCSTRSYPLLVGHRLTLEPLEAPAAWIKPQEIRQYTQFIGQS